MSFPLEKIAIRVHHRLVWIHLFPNGNGRHARLVADLILQQKGLAPFSWGSTNLRDACTMRQTYIQALKVADAGNFVPLLAFAQS